MRLKIWAAGLAMGWTLCQAPAALAQQQLKWDNYCTLGPTPLCSSIELDLTPDGGQTDVSIRLRNLEGTLGSTPWAFYNVAFEMATDLPDGIAVPSYHATYSGSAHDIVTADSATCATYPYKPGGGCVSEAWGLTEWDFFGAAAGSSGIGILESSGDWLPRPFGIVGCDLPLQPTGHYHALGFFQTCGAGWVNFDFTIFGSWMFDDNSTVSITTFDGDAISSCVFGETCVQQLTSTPEPANVALTATGFIGVAGFTRRRKKQRGILAAMAAGSLRSSPASLPASTPHRPPSADAGPLERRSWRTPRRDRSAVVSTD